MSEDALRNFGKPSNGLSLEEHGLVNKGSLLFDHKVYVTPLHRALGLLWVSCLCCLELLPLHMSRDVCPAGRGVVATHRVRAAVL